MTFLAAKLEADLFSTRAKHVIERENITTNEKFINFVFNGKLAGIRNVGTSTQSELEVVGRKLVAGATLHREEISIGNLTAFLLDSPRRNEIYTELFVTSVNNCNKTDYDFSSLSVRAQNALKRANIFKCEQLEGYTVEDLYAIPQLGKKSVEEIQAYLLAFHDMKSKSTKIQEDEAWVNVGFALMEERVFATKMSLMEFKEYVAKLKCNEITLQQVEQQVEHIENMLVPEVCFVENQHIAEEATCLAEMCVRNHIWLAEYSLGHLLWRMACGEENIQSDIEKMITEKIPHQDPLPTLEETLLKMDNDRSKDILFRKLNDETLEAIGDSLGLTRERIRQLCEKSVKRLHVQEDTYQSFFMNYEIEKKDYASLFGQSYIGAYLELKYGKGNKPLEEAMEDETLDMRLRKKVEQVVYQDYICDQGVMVKKSRVALTHHTIRWYCQGETTLEEFIEKYRILREKFDLGDEHKFGISVNSMANKLARYEDVVYHFNRKFRFYPLSTTDFSDLIDGLNFSQYENEEYSTLYFFRLHPELMQQYDIRDEYELHNILKKVMGEENAFSIHFEKMPIIEFGHAKPDEQVFELMLAMAPVDALTLGQAYEKKYGMQALTAMSSRFKCIREYFYKGIYQIDDEALPSDMIEMMKNVLDQEFYTFAELRQIYLAMNPAGKPSHINPYSVRQLGFNAFDDCAISPRYNSAQAYYRHLFLDSDGIIDVKKIPSRTKARGFESTLYDLRHNFDIVEFLPDQYLTMRQLEQEGITKQMLLEYCNAVDEFTKDEPFFTMKSLTQAGFTHPLDSLGFNDWFYMSLLSQEGVHFTVQKSGNTKFATRGKQELSRIYMISYIVSQYGSMTVAALLQMLEEHYGIRIAKDKIVELIKESSLYYDCITKKIYRDFATYRFENQNDGTEK